MKHVFTLLLAASCLTTVGQSDDCSEDLDFDGICDEVDPCVGIIDYFGVCNGGCFQNIDGDLICDDQDLCIDTNACNYNDPANDHCHYLDECGFCLSPSQALWCPFWEDFFYEMNLVLAPNCFFDGGVSGLVGLSLSSNGNIVGLQGNGIVTNIGAWSFNECNCIAGIASNQSELYLGATLSIPSITSSCGVENIQLMVDAIGNVFVETGCCQFVGSENQCLGAFDECGVCDGPGAIYDCGCDSKPFGDCDCNGNVYDVIGVCGGTCQSDYNNNGICDDQEVYGCTYNLAENFDSDATEDDGSCMFPCEGAVNINVFDWDEDQAVTIADFLAMLSVFGDVDLDSDGVWDSSDLCVDVNACNYDNDPSEPCDYIDALGTCGGGCEADEDNDGICDDIDTCIGIEDECGVCNGPGPTEVVIEDITILYDSVYAENIDTWFVYELGVDTTFSYECAPSFSECGDPLEYQGYDYETVQIGEQCWFRENLRSENYENGDAIPSSLSDNEWINTVSGASAVYDENDYNLEVYGRLYNWYAVDDSRGLCPSGWHVPTDGDWMTMEMALGMSETEANGTGGRGTDQGTQLKSTYGWNGGSQGTNSSGFSGLPGGFRVNSGDYYDAGTNGSWWSSSPIGSVAWNRTLLTFEQVYRDDLSRRYGFSIRCIKDSE